MKIYQPYLHRTMCDVLYDMRRMNKTRNYSGLIGLIEELQIMANRMEASLGMKKDIKLIQADWQKWKNRSKKMTKDNIKDEASDNS